MDSIRVTAKTVEDALTEASIQLATSSDNIEYTVIDEGSKGFFGIGGRKAVIEAKKKFTDEDLMKEVFGDSSSKPVKKSRMEKPVREPGKEAKKEPKKEAPKAQEVKKAPEMEEPVPEEKKEPKKEASADSRRDFRREPKKETGREPGRESRKTVSFEEKKNEKKEKASAPAPKADRQNQEEAAPETRAPRVPADPEEAKRRAVHFLSELFRVMETEVEIHASFEDETLSIDLSGDKVGFLIGKRGQTLDSLQYLTSLVVNKGKASYVRVKIDTEDYRNRRKATLENLAKNIAFKVKKTRRPVFLEPMNPYERRIIHSALQNDPYVTTHSEGDEPNRKVVITPRRKGERPSGGMRTEQ